MVLEKLNIHEGKKNNLDMDLTPVTKISSKCIIILNVKHKTIKLLDYNIGENVAYLGYNDAFLLLFFRILLFEKWTYLGTS